MKLTFLGSDIVGGDEETALARLRALAEERGVELTVAFDGMERVLR